MKAILSTFIILLFFSFSYGQPCNNIPSFSTAKEAIKWVESAGFKTKDYYYSSIFDDWLSEALYYPCEGSKGFLIVSDGNSARYISANVELQKWNELKSFGNIGEFYVDNIRSEKKYYYNNNPQNTFFKETPIPKKDTKDIIIINSIQDITNFKVKAEKGDINAQYNLGMIYMGNVEFGDIQDFAKFQDLELSEYWVRIAAEKGHVRAQVALGDGCFLRVYNTCKESFYWYKKAAENGHVRAQYMIGGMYSSGDGTLMDKKQAFYWYKKAAENGEAKAQLDLGFMYYEGNGTLIDKKQAFYWFQQAAENDNVKAQFNLGIMYSDGDGTLMDKKQAAIWIRKAYENGFKLAKKYWEQAELWKYE